ncbi:histamine H1 receptor-like [Argopecten irradians]|uniref:histamine H1 receptor-like n=1 Tax=Argopecten irradians TaxID=31199 RepID=UPI00371611F8
MSNDYYLEFNGTTPDYFLFPWDNFVYNTSNSTSLNKNILEDNLWRKIPLSVLLLILCLLTVVGNAMVLHAVRTERRLQTVSNMYIVSLAVADLIVGIFVMPVSTVYIFTEEWIFGVAVCQIWIVIDYTASTASILNLFILSVDRYWSVTSPLKYLRKRTKRRALKMISIVWLLSSLWIIPIVSWHHIANNGVRRVHVNVCDTEYAHDSVFKVITAFFNFYLPLAIMYSLYGKVFHEIRKRSALELGQRYSRPIVADMQYAADSPTIDNSSDGRLDSYSDENHSIKTDSSNYSSIKLTSCNAVRSKKSKKLRKSKPSKSKRKHYKRRSQEENNFNFNPKCKVEYIYDENVLDPKTEKVERFFYQEHVPISNKPPREILISTPIICNEPSISSGGTPVSSSSEERRTLAYKAKKERQNYSLVSGLRHMRQAEHIIDHTVAVTRDGNGVTHIRNSSNGRARGGSAMLFDEESNSRRMSSSINIKHRIKNIRQSSLKKEIKAARQLGVIMGAFTLCFLPYFILFLVIAFCPNCIHPDLMTAMTWIGYLNSTLNPVLYPLCNANFRRKFWKMLRLDREQRRRRHNVRTVERNSFTMRYD